MAIAKPQEAFGIKSEHFEDVENPGLRQVVKDLHFEVEVPKWTLLWAWLSNSGPVIQCPGFIVEVADKMLSGDIRRFRVSDYPHRL